MENNLFESIEILAEKFIKNKSQKRSRAKFIPHKLTKPVKRKIKKTRKKAHRGTNWKTLKPRTGFKRVKLPGSKTYVLVRLKQKERYSKKKLMRLVAKRKDFKK